MRTNKQANSLLVDWVYNNCWHFGGVLVCSVDALSRQRMGSVAVVYSLRPPRWDYAIGYAIIVAPGVPFKFSQVVHVQVVMHMNSQEMCGND